MVLADGRHHTFAQFGAGTFVPGVRSHLGPEFVLHPGGLLVEADRLAAVRVSDALARLTVDARATVISPFQQAAGRLRRLLRGDAAHGTCGVGVGEAVGDRLAGHDDVLVAADLRGGGDVLLQRLARQQRRKRAELRLFAAGPGGVVTGAPDAGDRRLYALRQDARAALEWGLLSDPDAPARVVEAWAPFGDAVRVARPADAEALLRQAGAVVFEGAQGSSSTRSTGSTRTPPGRTARRPGPRR